MFSVLQLNDVRGRTDATPAQPMALADGPPAVSMGEALATAQAQGQGHSEIGRISLHQRLGHQVYSVSSPAGALVAMIDANRGAVLGEISAAQATAIALSDFRHPSSVLSVDYLSKEMPADDVPGEFRGRDLPAYRVVLDHEREPHIYIDAFSGKVVARRNDLWRIFDFFWMLHIMDYDKRENFNHPLLVAASGFAVLSALSGLVLWAVRLPRLFRRRRQKPKSHY